THVPVGATFTRVTVTHFTAWDVNLLAFDSLSLTTTPRVDEDPTPDDPCEQQAASIIRCEARALAEVVDAPDSHVTLRYDSRRSPGRTASTTVRVPLPDEAAVAGLRRLTVEVTVAGVTQQQTFTADEVAATGEAVFTWDGRD